MYLLFSNGLLELWHLYAAALTTSTLGIFQRLAYQTSVTVLVPRAHLGRANALVQTAESFSGIVSPILGGLLFVVIGINGIFIVDFATFLVAAGTLLIVRIPVPKNGAEGKKPSLFSDIRQGFDFLKGRKGLVSLALFIAMLNVLVSLCAVLITPMMLSFATPQILGLVQAALSVGLLLGGIWISIWGGPQRKVLGICLAALGSGFGLAFTGVRQDPVWIAAGLFIFLFPITLINASIRAIVQTKVLAAMQGRVFSLVFTLARVGVPFAFLAAGPLADRVFEPALRLGGSLATTFVGHFLGVGPGRGIGLMFVLAGMGMLVVTLLMYSYPRMRLVEKELPDAPVETE
ncbi:MAG: MFS transporter [Anaerolineales bacterium]